MGLFQTHGRNIRSGHGRIKLLNNMSLSIYTSLYNAQKMSFDWKGALQNWISFLDRSGEIVIIVNTSEDDTLSAVREFAKTAVLLPSQVLLKVIEASISYSDPAFDGKLKALALSHCTQPFAMLLDIDELLVPGQKKLWLNLARELEMNRSFDAFLVPVVDLIGDEQHFRSIGSKFYIHRNDPNITRGVHKQAYREDGSFDKTKSDSTEAIYVDTQEVVRSKSILVTGLPPFLIIGYLEGGEVPFVIHTGWVNMEQRLKQAAFWRKIWDIRDGGHSKEPELTLADLEKIPRYKHNLPPWK